MVIICPEVTKSWSTVCSVLPSKDAKNNHMCLLEAKDMIKLQPLCPFTVCKQLGIKKKAFMGYREKTNLKSIAIFWSLSIKFSSCLPGLSSPWGGMFWALPLQSFPWPCCSQMSAVCLSSIGHGLQIVEHGVPYLPSPLQGSKHCASVGWEAGKDAVLCKHKLRAQPVKG